MGTTQATTRHKSAARVIGAAVIGAAVMLTPLNTDAQEADTPVAAAPESAAEDYRLFSSEDIFNLEYAADPQVSPDGRRIAYVRTAMDRMSDGRTGAIWVVDVDSGAQRPLITDEGSVSTPRWSPDGRRLLYMARGETGAELRVRYLDDGSSVALGHFPQTPRGAVWSPDSAQIAFAMITAEKAPSFATPPAAPDGAQWAKPVRVFDDLPFRFDGAGYLPHGAIHLYVMPAEGGAARALTSGETSYSSPAWLNDDTLIAVADAGENSIADPIESTLVSVSLSDGAITLLTERDGPEVAPQVSPDGRRIAYLGYDDKVMSYQQTELYVMDADGGEPRLLTGEFDRSIDAARWRPDGQGLIVQFEDMGDVVLGSINLAGELYEMTRDVGGTAIGRPYASGSFHVNGGAEGLLRQRWAIGYTLGSRDRPAEVAVLVNGAGNRTLTSLNEDALGHVDLSTLQGFEVASPVDGAPIPAWVALPPGFEADGSAPMVMEIHGGPYAMYGPTFSAEIQRFAAEGYVTVYANPRGSTGYGETFAQHINRAYPGEDYDDLMAVVDYLVAENFVDPNRLFVTGGSGGGTLTAWIIGKTDRFAAAASIKPVINWTTMALAADAAPFFMRYWMQALPWEDPETYWRLSPISLAGNVTTPTMVMVGEEDWRTPTWESEQFFTALKLQGVDTALVRVPGSAHFIAARPSQMIAKVDNIIGWFDKYDPGPSAPSEEATDTPSPSNAGAEDPAAPTLERMDTPPPDPTGG